MLFDRVRTKDGEENGLLFLEELQRFPNIRRNNITDRFAPDYVYNAPCGEMYVDYQYTTFSTDCFPIDYVSTATSQNLKFVTKWGKYQNPKLTHVLYEHSGNIFSLLNFSKLRVLFPERLMIPRLKWNNKKHGRSGYGDSWESAYVLLYRLELKKCFD